MQLHDALKQAASTPGAIVSSPGGAVYLRLAVGDVERALHTPWVMLVVGGSGKAIAADVPPAYYQYDDWSVSDQVPQLPTVEASPVTAPSVATPEVRSKPPADPKGK